MVGFCFGIGLMLAVKTVNNLECCINRKCLQIGRRKSSNERTTRRSCATATNNERTTTSNYKEPKESRTGKRLAESNSKKREAKKQAKLEASGVNQYYGIGVVLALGVIGGLGYYIYWSKKGEQPQRNNPKPHPQTQPQTNKFEMD